MNMLGRYVSTPAERRELAARDRKKRRRRDEDGDAGAENDLEAAERELRNVRRGRVPLLEFLGDAEIRLLERVLASDEEQLMKASQQRWTREDVRYLKEHLALRSCAVPETLADAFDSHQMFVQQISTGDADLDKLLGGGLWPKEITELCGPTGSAKTQFALSAASLVATSPRGGRVVFVDASNAFKASRFRRLCLDRLAAARAETTEPGKEDPLEKLCDKALARMRVMPVFDVQALSAALASILQLETADPDSEGVRFGPLRLLVVDSISALFAPILGGKNSTSSYAALSRVALMLRTIGMRFGVAILVINSTVHDFSSPVDGRLKPALGLSWATVPDSRVSLRPLARTAADTVSARLVKSCRRKLPSSAEKETVLRTPGARKTEVTS